MRLCDGYEDAVKQDGEFAGAQWLHEVCSCHKGGLAAADEFLDNNLKSYIGQEQEPAASYGMTTDCNISLGLSQTGGRQKDRCESNEKALARIAKAVQRMTKRKGNATKLVYE